MHECNNILLHYSYIHIIQCIPVSAPGQIHRTGKKRKKEFYMSNAELTQEELKEKKDVLKFKIFYPLSEFLAGIQKQFFGIYLQFFYTNVYMFSVTFTAAMTLTSNLVSWVITPTFSAFVDRFKFKKAKYWPWLIFGTVIVYGIQVLITLLPTLPERPRLSQASYSRWYSFRSSSDPWDQHLSWAPSRRWERLPLTVSSSQWDRR